MVTEETTQQDIDGNEGEAQAAEALDLAELEGERKKTDARTVSLLILSVLALIYTFYYAKPVLLPIILGMLFYFLFRPMHDFLACRLKLPHTFAAATIIGGIFMIVAGTTYYLAGPARTWIDEFSLLELRNQQYRLQRLMEPVEKVTAVAEQVDEMTSVARRDDAIVVRTNEGKTGVVSYVQATIAYLAFAFILVFFLLAYGEVFQEKLHPRSKVLLVMGRIGRQISRYLMTITIINIVLGVCVGLTMLALGMPNPLLWGAMAFVFNYIPYIGAIVGVGIIAFVSLITNDTFWSIALPPLAYFALTSIEGNFITPALVGQSLRMNPILIFVSILFFGWIWGVAGGLMAVPLLMAIKIVLSHFRTTRRMAELMSM